MSSIKQDLRVGDSVSFDDGKIKITVMEKSGQRVRLDIQAGQEVTVKVNKASTSSAVAKNGITLPSMQAANANI